MGKQLNRNEAGKKELFVSVVLEMGYQRGPPRGQKPSHSQPGLEAQ